MQTWFEIASDSRKAANELVRSRYRSCLSRAYTDRRDHWPQGWHDRSLLSPTLRDHSPPRPLRAAKRMASKAEVGRVCFQCCHPLVKVMVVLPNATIAAVSRTARVTNRRTNTFYRADGEQSAAAPLLAIPALRGSLMSRKPFAILVFVISVVWLGGCSVPQVGSKATPQATARATAEESIPFELDSGVPVVTATLNGNVTARLLLDTGSEMLVLNKDFAVRHGIELVRRSRAAVDVGGREHPTSYAVLHKVEIGGVTINGFGAIVTEFGNSLAVRYAGEVDGLLSWTCLQDYLVTLDYPSRHLRLAAGSLPTPNGANVLPLGGDARYLTIPITVGRTSTTCYIDTAWEDSAPLWIKSPLHDQMSVSISHQQINGEATGDWLIKSQFYGLVDDLVVGCYHFGVPMTVVFDDGLHSDIYNAVIGPNVLSHFIVTFDFKNRRLQLALPEESNIATHQRWVVFAPPDRPVTILGPNLVNGQDVGVSSNFVVPPGEIVSVSHVPRLTRE